MAAATSPRPADTIFALSSGTPPAAIAIVRISGPQAFGALTALAGDLPAPRYAALRTLRHVGLPLDEALTLTFPAPATATGEDVAELHLHGGRATVAAVLAALAAQPGLRLAEPGEFTRRALANGRLDLNEAEGLADLLRAETETQRRAAFAGASGALSRQIEAWRGQVLDASARIEAAIDYAEDEAVEPWPERAQMLEGLADQIVEVLASPPAERIRDGFRVAVLGPPNAGKSSLINALASRDAAIVSSMAGTTRDVIEVPLQMDGEAVVLLDTAGLNEATVDPIEREGIARAQRAAKTADLVLWLGPPAEIPPGALLVAPKSDLQGGQGLAVSARTFAGLPELRGEIAKRAQLNLREDSLALNLRQRTALRDLASQCRTAAQNELLLAAEDLRAARATLDRLAGRSGVEDMLDALFGRFCLGK